MMAAQTAVPTPYADDVEILADLGYYPVPIHAGRKEPIISGWRTLTREQAVALAEVHPHASVGVRCDNIRAVDVDFTDPELSGLIEAYLLERVVQDGEALIRVGQAPKFALLCGATGRHRKRTSAAWVDPNDPTGKPQKVETLGEGQQVVLSGIHPITGRPYTWKNGGPVARGVAVYELPVITDEQLDALDRYVFDTVTRLRPHFVLQGDARSAHQGDDLEAPFPVAGLTLDLAREALSFAPNDDVDYDTWLEVGMALHQQGAGDPDWFEVWNEWSANSAKDRGERVNWKHWESFQADRPGGVTMRTILLRCQDNGWTRPPEVEGARVDVEEFPNMDQEESQSPNSEKTREAPPSPDGIVEVDLADLALADLPPQEYAIAKYLPVNFLALFSGHGGSGKSTLALQLAVHVAMGIDFANHKVTRAKVIVYSAEDDKDMLRRRIQGICRHLGVDPAELAQWMVVLDVTAIDPVLYQEVNERGTRSARYTKAFESLYRRSHAFRAGFVLVDNRSEVYGSEENERKRVGHFCRMLTTLARKLTAAVLLVAHVDKQTAKGLSSQRYSGSTQWYNSARSVIYLGRDPEAENVYLLEHDKLNMDKPEDPLQLGFQPVGNTGVLVPVEQAEWVHDQKRNREEDEEQAVLDALAAAVPLQNVPTARSGPYNTLTVLAHFDELPAGMRKGEGKRAFWAALSRLEKQGKIAREEYMTAHRNPRERWIICGDPKGERDQAEAEKAQNAP